MRERIGNVRKKREEEGCRICISMFSKLYRKISNFFRIPFTFKNWTHVMWYVLSFYLTKGSRSTGFVLLRDGQRLKIRLSNNLDVSSVIEVYNRKEYSPSFISKPVGGKVIDVGASIGDFTICAASLWRASRVFAYEPNLSAYELLKENIGYNKLNDKVVTFPLAVSDQRGQIRVGEHAYNSVSIKDIFVDNEIECCDVLKMDIEGAEYVAFFNTPIEILKRINAIVMECHVYNKDQDPDKLKDYLAGAGFDVITTGINAHKICYLYARRK